MTQGSIPAKAVPERIVFTIASKNYVSYALTLLESLATADPGARRIFVLADTPEGLEHITLPAELLPAEQLRIPGFEDMVTRYSVMELNTAIKPFVFLHLFDACPDATCIYLDPDILVLAPLDEVDSAIEAGAELVLTPHITQPLQDGLQPEDLTIMKSGIWNLGFAAMRCTASTRMLARWWADRCVADCRVDIPGNIFTDQRWMDLAPAFVERTAIIRHPGYNLAYWNLSHRPVEVREGSYLAAGEPLVFAHFSGVVPDAPEVYSKHQNRFRAADTGGLAGLLAHYQQRLLANGWRETSRLSYAWSSSPSGRRIVDAMRLHYREAFPRPPTPGELYEARFDGCLPEWMDQPGSEHRVEAPLTRLVWRCWQMRDDLRSAFDIRSADGRRAMLEWFTHCGTPDFGADAESIAAVKRALETPRETGPEPRLAWPRQRSFLPPAPHGGADTFFAEDVCAAFPEGTIAIPRQLALLWESRHDLRAAFKMRSAGELEDYLLWSLISGVPEGTVDPSLFTPWQPLLERLTRTTGTRAWPCSPLLRAAGKAYDGFLGPVEHNGMPGREEDAVRIIAFMLCRWPPASRLPSGALTGYAKWLNSDPQQRPDEPPLPRISRLLHASRPDVQAMYATDAPQGRLGLLGWYLLGGRIDHGLESIPLPDTLGAWLGGADETGPGLRVPNVLRLIHATREDLRATVDLDDRESLGALHAWFDASGRHEYPQLTAPPEPLTATSGLKRRQEPLVLIGFPGSPTGRGEDSRMTAGSLGTCGIQASLLNRADSLPFAPPIDADIAISHLNAETALEDHVWMRRMGIRARWHIGYWAWELSDFPEEWLYAFGMYDEIWASTEFARAAFAKRSPKPVRLMPMAVALPSPPPGLDRLSFRLPADSFLFFTSFDFRSFSARKNPEAAIRAFCIAFPNGNEAVSLVVKTLHAQDDTAAAERLRDLARVDPRVLLIDRTLGREEITALMAACDAFVSLHRSEGFGRGPAEAMLLGKPVVVTAYSGNLDFCREDNACLVPSTLVPVREGEYPGWEGQVWADPDPAVAAAHMRRLVEDPDAAVALGARAAATIRAQYGMDIVGLAYAERLLEIRESLQCASGNRAPVQADTD